VENRGILPSFFIPPFFVLLRKINIPVTFNTEVFLVEADHYPFPLSTYRTGLFLNKVFQIFPDKHLFLLIQRGQNRRAYPLCPSSELSFYCLSFVVFFYYQHLLTFDLFFKTLTNTGIAPPFFYNFYKETDRSQQANHTTNTDFYFFLISL